MWLLVTRAFIRTWIKTIDYLYEHRKAALTWDAMKWMEIRSFSLVQENTLNQEANDQFEYHKKYADFHLLVAGHEYSAYGSQVVDEVAFDEEADIGFVRCQNRYPLLLGYHNFATFFPGAHQPNGYMQVLENVENIFKF